MEGGAVVVVVVVVVVRAAGSRSRVPYRRHSHRSPRSRSAQQRVVVGRRTSVAMEATATLQCRHARRISPEAEAAKGSAGVMRRVRTTLHLRGRCVNRSARRHQPATATA